MLKVLAQHTGERGLANASFAKQHGVAAALKDRVHDCATL